ncbi:MAG: hypothetical protein H7247_13760 [Polaromonas sp.]|nr:hypothetical protein [Gemmatimonadaceae bacterium]
MDRAAAQRPDRRPVSGGDKAVVAGRVSSPGVKTDIPIAGVMVTLHRVGTDSSGPVDSIRTGAAGHYALHYRRLGTDDAVYFAAAVYRGIAYFTTPLKSQRATGEEGEITVFDTTSRAVNLHVRGHHVVVSGPRPDGLRNIVEVWELSNDTTVTVVGRDSLTPVWTGILPGRAANFAAGEGDVSAGALVPRGDRVVLLAPFGPGVKQISYSYTLPPGVFPLTVALEAPTVVLEVLAEEPGAQVTGAGLRSMAAATTGGRTFKRFLAQDVPAGSQVRVTVPLTAEGTRTKVLIGVAALIVVVMAGALARALVGRRVAAPGRVVPRERASESLIAAIAQLDAGMERGDTTLDAAAYPSHRAALKEQLAAALAAERHSSS